MSLILELVVVGDMVARRTVEVDDNDGSVKVLTLHELMTIEEANCRIDRWNARCPHDEPMAYFVPEVPKG